MRDFEKSFIFVNNENYYIIYFDESNVYIDAYKFKNNKLIEIKVDNILFEYFKFYEKLSWKDKRNYIWNLEDKLTFNIPKNIFSNKFCDKFLVDLDPHFLYKDKHAKHFILDFEAIKNKKELFFKEPKLFPFYISYLDVMIDENYKIYKNNQEISESEVFKLDEEYIQNLIPLIIKKDKIFLAITHNLKKNYYYQKDFLDLQKISDYNLDIEVTIFDITGNILFDNFYNSNSFKNDLGNLKFYGIDMFICRLLWMIIDKFGIRIVTTKLNLWSEVKCDLQMFYKV